MSLVEFEVREGVAVVTLNRPEARNAVSPELARELHDAIDRLETDPELRVGVLRATMQPDKPVFCAGADLKAINEGRSRDLMVDGHGFGGLTLRTRSKPLIAAIDGLATAGGCELALACDLIVASRRAAFGLAEVRRGLIAGAGGLYRLPWAIGEREATRVILTGKPISAERAHELGLVTELTDDGAVDAAAFELAADIVAGAPLAVSASLEVIRASRTEPEAELVRRSDDAMRAMLASDDVKEGVQAFLERRPPRWLGR